MEVEHHEEVTSPLTTFGGDTVLPITEPFVTAVSIGRSEAPHSKRWNHRSRLIDNLQETVFAAPRLPPPLSRSLIRLLSRHRIHVQVSSSPASVGRRYEARYLMVLIIDVVCFRSIPVWLLQILVGSWFCFALRIFRIFVTCSTWCRTGSRVFGGPRF